MGTAVYMDLPVDQIILDTSNPRIAKWLEMYSGDIDYNQIKLALYGAGDSQSGDSGSTFYSLRESIKNNGGVIHPILVNRVNNQYIAIEGNTRTMIYIEFKKDGVQGKWDTIPAMVYDNLDMSVIDSIRLQAHLVGPRQWDPYSKAKYLHRLSSCDQAIREQDTGLSVYMSRTDHTWQMGLGLNSVS